MPPTNTASQCYLFSRLPPVELALREHQGLIFFLSPVFPLLPCIISVIRLFCIHCFCGGSKPILSFRQTISGGNFLSSISATNHLVHPSLILKWEGSEKRIPPARDLNMVAALHGYAPLNSCLHSVISSSRPCTKAVKIQDAVKIGQGRRGVIGLLALQLYKFTCQIRVL